MVFFSFWVKLRTFDFCLRCCLSWFRGRDGCGCRTPAVDGLLCSGDLLGLDLCLSCLGNVMTQGLTKLTHLTGRSGGLNCGLGHGLLIYGLKENNVYPAHKSL